jgi:hypothetical protein
LVVCQITNSLEKLLELPVVFVSQLLIMDAEVESQVA